MPQGQINEIDFGDLVHLDRTHKLYFSSDISATSAHVKVSFRFHVCSLKIFGTKGSIMKRKH